MNLTGNNRISRKRVPLYVAAALAGLLVVAGSIFTVAVFTNSLHAQRTIAAYDVEGARFSSNYLLKGNSKNNVRTFYTTDPEVPAAGLITICNYPQGHQTMCNIDNFQYSLTARLVRFDENEDDRYVPVDAAYMAAFPASSYTVTVTDGASASIVLSDAALTGRLPASGSYAFTGGTARADVFEVSFSPSFAANQPNLYLELTATPSDGTLPTIRGIFKPALRAAGAANHWTGAFRDDTSHAANQYSGFNYLITGTGSGTVTLTWDTTRIRISDKSLDDLLSIAGATGSAGQVVFPVDSDDESRYDLQFYPVSITDETWTQMNNSVVTFAFS